ncbi:MAG: iscU [Chthonomonadaceae bacterium]|nr:iscU [Chthonomonadaceae bacterium]
MSDSAIPQLFNDPKTLGPLPGADVTGRAGVQGEGPFLYMHLKFAGGRIECARFETYGCPVAIACGSWVTQWVAGRTPEQALLLEANDLRTLLGGVPLGKEHCADLAVNALRDGLRQARMEGANA